MQKTIDENRIISQARELFQEERQIRVLDGWFLILESHMKHAHETEGMSPVMRAAWLMARAIEELPISISPSAVFAGTQRDAFAASYALINPSFQVESFAGYCDPTAVFNDIKPSPVYSRERIEAVRGYIRETPYVRDLTDMYQQYGQSMEEVVFFVEQVTGHIVPDFRGALEHGVLQMCGDIDSRLASETDPLKRDNLSAMKLALEAAVKLALRYANLAEQMAREAVGDEKEAFQQMAATLRRVPAYGASGLKEAIQSFIILWQVMCIEQAPNPFAFSVGNADRIFEPYRAKEGLSREEAAAYLAHLLVFFNVGDRSWAISQNLIISGRDAEGKDLTNPTSYALLDAYFTMNLPQPILSVKLHQGSPQALYEELGRFFFSPGCLTPSLFNDDSMFPILLGSGTDPQDVQDYGIAGCQEPLIMGKDNGNTTASWLNLAKILELTLNEGVSLITGKEIGCVCEPLPPGEALADLRRRFHQNLSHYAELMRQAANKAAEALSHMPVPFLSTAMGGIEIGYDMRDTRHQGTKYNGNGCLIHGLSVVSDSFVAVDHLLAERPQDAERLITALRNDFADDPELRRWLKTRPKYGNNEREADAEAVRLAGEAADLVNRLKNSLGNPYRADFATPSTHLLYGYWVGALPDGRQARDMLNYGVDPFHGDANNGLGLRTLSTMKLPYEKFVGGYASHLGIDPKYFTASNHAQRGLQFRDRVLKPLFFNALQVGLSPFYLYVNVTTAQTLRAVLANPKEYAPNGVYIMRIHGTFVNFLDLSPAIQEDIICRLDPDSTAIS